MDSDKWKQARELYEAALIFPPDKRSQFLEENCNGDEELHQEVKSLLGYVDEAGSFLESPAINQVAEEIISQKSLVGQKFLQYKIIKPIGAGGMGEVYLARDTRLDRQVAIKFLNPEFSQDAEKLKRFIQEAKAVSALNHPNILTVYDVNEANGIHFIATEFIDGETLREKLGRESLTIEEVLDSSIQTASALSAAHEAGIIHRDIKPENIILRRDRLVKVLDFGLAKLTEINQAEIDYEADTVAQVKTEPGVVMGTVAYMSPEQARGKETDTRTDIWSLGCVMYEMLTGRTPFAGETNADRIAAIINKEPTSLVRLNENTPARLEEIVAKCLEKDRDERYQIVKDLLIDLRRLKRKLDLDSEIERSQMPTDLEKTSGQKGAQTQILSTPPIDTAQTPQATSSAEYIVTEIKRHKWLTAFVALGLIALVAVAWAAYRWFGGAGKTNSTVPFQNAQISILQNSGKINSAAISPDGKYVAFVDNSDEKNYSLKVRQMATGSTVELIPASPAVISGSLIFSLDGNYIYFRLEDIANKSYPYHRIPTLGGTPRKILEKISYQPTFAPDGRRFAFISYDSDTDTVGKIMIADTDGGNLQTLYDAKKDNIVFHNDPAWSPDGKKIIVPVREKIGDDFIVNLMEISTTDGSHKPFAAIKFKNIADILWLKDGSGLLFIGYDKNEAFSQFWHVAYPGGEVRRVTNDSNEYKYFSLTADNSVILAHKSVKRASLVRVDPASKETVQIIPESGENPGEGGVAQTPDGKLVFNKLREGDFADLWISDADGKNAQQLTSNAIWNSNPVVTSDKRYIVFVSNRTGNGKIWRMDINGNNQVQLTKDEAYRDFFLQLTPDGKTVVFTRGNADRSGNTSVMRISIEGGEATPLLTADDGLSKAVAAISPDGKFLAYFVWNPETKKSILKIAEFDSASVGKTVKEFDWEKKGAFRFLPDRKTAVYQCLVEGIENICQMQLDGVGKPKQLTNFTSGQVFGLAVSWDGKQVFTSHSNTYSDLVLIKDGSDYPAN